MAETRRSPAPHAHFRRGYRGPVRLVLAVESVRCICGRLILLQRIRGQDEFARLAGRCAACDRGATLHVEIEATQRRGA